MTKENYSFPYFVWLDRLGTHGLHWENHSFQCEPYVLAYNWPTGKCLGDTEFSFPGRWERYIRFLNISRLCIEIISHRFWLCTAFNKVKVERRIKERQTKKKGTNHSSYYIQSSCRNLLLGSSRLITLCNKQKKSCLSEFFSAKSFVVIQKKFPPGWSGWKDSFSSKKLFWVDQMYWRLRTNVFCHNYCSCIVLLGPHRDFRVELPT